VQRLAGVGWGEEASRSHRIIGNDQAGKVVMWEPEASGDEPVLTLAEAGLRADILIGYEATHSIRVVPKETRSP
jgi:hypothetical protein